MNEARAHVGARACKQTRAETGTGTNLLDPCLFGNGGDARVRVHEVDGRVALEIKHLVVLLMNQSITNEMQRGTETQAQT